MYSQIEQKLNGRWDKSSIIFKIDHLIKTHKITATRHRYSETDDATIIDMYKKNASTSDIANMLGATKRGVNNRIEKY